MTEPKRHIMYRIDLPDDPDIAAIFKGVMVDNVGHVFFDMKESGAILHEIVIPGWGNLLGVPVGMFERDSMYLGFRAIEPAERHHPVELTEAFKKVLASGKRAESVRVDRATEVRRLVRSGVRDFLVRYRDDGLFDEAVLSPLSGLDNDAAERELDNIIEYLSK